MNTLREDVAGCLLVAADLIMRGEVVSDEDVEQAMLETSLALVWMRKLPGGMAARDRLEDRAKAELAKRRADKP